MAKKLLSNISQNIVVLHDMKDTLISHAAHLKRILNMFDRYKQCHSRIAQALPQAFQSMFVFLIAIPDGLPGRTLRSHCAVFGQVAGMGLLSHGRQNHNQ